MERTRQALADLVSYDAAAALRPLALPEIDKVDIPGYIRCPGYERARSRIERAMERYRAKVAQAEERVNQSKAHIAELEQALEDWSKRAKGVSTMNRIMLDRSDPDSVERYNRDVAKHNDAVEQVRRYQDRLDDAIDKHNDLVERYTDAVREAEDRLEELSLEAISEIDQDVASCLERCTQVAARLSRSEVPEDALSALETCFITLKLHAAFDDHLERPEARREARAHAEEVSRLLFDLCSHKELRDALVKLYFSNVHLVSKNAGLYSETLKAIEGTDQAQLSDLTASLQRLLGRKFRTSYSYTGVVDPGELDSTVRQMEATVNAINASVSEAEHLFKSSHDVSETAVQTHQQAESLLSQMKTGVMGMGDGLLYQGHFAADILEPQVIEGLLSRELRTAASGLREYLLETLGEEAINAILGQAEDRYFISRCQQAIGQADLLRLQSQREQVEGHVRKLISMASNVRLQVQEAGNVPGQNAERFRQLASYLYPLSCFPILGFVATWFLLRKIDEFEKAFRSSNEVYRELGAELLDRNTRLKKLNTIAFINIISALMLSRASEKLEAFMGGTAQAAPQEERIAVRE